MSNQWEAALRGERMTVRWSADERRGRVVLLTLAAGGTAYYLYPTIAPAGGSADALLMRWVALLGFTVYLLMCASAWYGKRWTFDRRSGTLTEGVARRAALSDLSGVRIKRIKVFGTGGVVFRVFVERAGGAEPLYLGEMAQQDAHAVGVAVSRFTGLPLIEH